MDFSLIMALVILALSIFFLLKSADWFTGASEHLGQVIGLSPFVIGATIVSVGSSLPEVVTSMVAIFTDNPDSIFFTADNVVGSNIANSLLVAGGGSVWVSTVVLKNKISDGYIPFLFLSTGVFLFFIQDSVFNFWEGLLSLLIFFAFLGHVLSRKVEEKKIATISVEPKQILFLIGSAAILYFSAKYTVSSVLNISDILGVSSSVLTLIVVAIGTSIPELAITTRAILNKKVDIAIGNIFGSNIFNLLFVMGFPSFFISLQISEAVTSYGIPFLIISTLGLIFVTFDHIIRRWESIALVIVYAIFILKITQVV